MSIVKTDVPMTADLCEETIAQLVRTYPFLRSRQIAATAYGRPVLTLELGQGSRKVMHSASHHANEWITTPVILKFVEELAEAAENHGTVRGVRASDILDAATIYTVPMVNPDGVELVTGGAGEGSGEYEAAEQIGRNYPLIPFPSGWKANLLGVDLNLQYPAGWLEAREIKFAEGFTKPAPRDYVGRAPLSQPETVAMADYTEEIDPDLVVAWHTQGGVIYWQFKDYQIPGARLLAEEFARVSGYAMADTPYESSFAGYKDWFIQRFRRPGFTIEAGQGVNPLPISQFDEIYRDCLGILVTSALGLAD